MGLNAKRSLGITGEVVRKYGLQVQVVAVGKVISNRLIAPPHLLQQYEAEQALLQAADTVERLEGAQGAAVPVPGTPHTPAVLALPAPGTPAPLSAATAAATAAETPAAGAIAATAGCGGSTATGSALGVGRHEVGGPSTGGVGAVPGTAGAKQAGKWGGYKHHSNKATVTVGRGGGGEESSCFPFMVQTCTELTSVCQISNPRLTSLPSLTCQPWRTVVCPMQTSSTCLCTHF